MLNGAITVVFQVCLALIPFYLFLRDVDIIPGLALLMRWRAGRRPLLHLVQEPPFSGRE